MHHLLPVYPLPVAMLMTDSSPGLFVTTLSMTSEPALVLAQDVWLHWTPWTWTNEFFIVQTDWLLSVVLPVLSSGPAGGGRARRCYILIEEEEEEEEGSQHGVARCCSSSVWFSRTHRLLPVGQTQTRRQPVRREMLHIHLTQEQWVNVSRNLKYTEVCLVWAALRSTRSLTASDECVLLLCGSCRDVSAQYGCVCPGCSRSMLVLTSVNQPLTRW